MGEVCPLPLFLFLRLCRGDTGMPYNRLRLGSLYMPQVRANLAPIEPFHMLRPGDPTILVREVSNNEVWASPKHLSALVSKEGLSGGGVKPLCTLVSLSHRHAVTTLHCLNERVFPAVACECRAVSIVPSGCAYTPLFPVSSHDSSLPTKVMLFAGGQGIERRLEFTAWHSGRLTNDTYGDCRASGCESVVREANRLVLIQLHRVNP